MKTRLPVPPLPSAAVQGSCSREETEPDGAPVWLARLPAAPEAARFASASDSFRSCLVTVAVINQPFPEATDVKQKCS